MDTKLKNIKYSLAVKAIVFIIMLASILAFAGTCIFYGYYYDELNNKTYYYSTEFQWDYAHLVHNAVELATQLKNEDHIKASGQDNESIREKIDRLDRIMDHLSETVNFKYYIRNTKTEEFFSNLSATEEEDAIALLKEQPSGVHFDRLHTVDSFPMNRDIQEMLDNTPYEVYAAVVEPLQPGDEFYTDYVTYTKVNALAHYIPPAIISSLLLLTLSFTYLCIVSGRKEKNGEIQLTFIDRLYTDIHLLLVFIAALFSIMLVREFSYLEDKFFIFTGSAVLAIDAVIGLSFIFSMIRQIKSRQLLKNSMIYQLLTALRNWLKVLFNGKLFKPIVIILLIAYGGVNGILFSVFANYYGGGARFISAVMLLALNIFVVYFTAKSLFSLSHIMNTTKEISAGNLNHVSDTSKVSPVFSGFFEDILNIQAGLKKAVMEAVKGERMKADLITNVSHDLKTPLTSIITYVDLLKKEDLNNEKADEFVGVLEEKSSRLKQLIEDLVEASKASSGNLRVEPEKIDLHELVLQAYGEYEEKFHSVGLNVRISECEERVFIYADGKYMWRIVENLMSNVIKYSLNHSRVYIDIKKSYNYGQLTIKNISAAPLDISPEQLTQRFVRGDTARTTEGSGLGLSIAESLTRLQSGEFNIQIDGDLFKTILEIPLWKNTD